MYKIKFAYSTNAFVKYGVLDSIKKISELGFEGVELLIDTPHINPLKCSQDILITIKRKIQQLDMKISNLNINTAICLKESYGKEPTLINSEFNLRNIRIDYTIKAIKIASFLGAQNVSITSGQKFREMDDIQALKNFVDSLEKILKTAEKLGIKIGIEYEPAHFINSFNKFENIYQQVKSKYLGLNFDIGHAYVMNENIKQILKKAREYIWNIHIEDIKDRKHYHLIPGEGDIDFRNIFMTLSEIEYDGFLTVELYTYKEKPKQAGKKALNYLVNLKP